MVRNQFQCRTAVVNMDREEEFSYNGCGISTSPTKTNNLDTQSLEKEKTEKWCFLPPRVSCLITGIPGDDAKVRYSADKIVVRCGKSELQKQR